MRRLLAAVTVAILAAGPAIAAEQIGGEHTFSFVALGDMPYDVPDDYAKFDRLIAAINASKPAFSVHVGDIKNGTMACTDDAFKTVYDQFQSFEQPLLYAIGDNEWVDCHRSRSGPNDPRERLAKVREMFFAKPDQSLGKTPMAIESQASAMPVFAKYVENSRFSKNGVLFVVLNMPGSNNGLETFDVEAAKEFFERNAANVAWIDDSFRKARENGDKAVVLAFQANPYATRDSTNRIPPSSGFAPTLNAIERGAKEFEKPVLVIQGDQHTLEVSAFRNVHMDVVPNVLRLQVMGENLVHAVRVTVDPDSAGVFGFIPLIVPENGKM